MEANRTIEVPPAEHGTWHALAFREEIVGKDLDDMAGH